jgi:FKBP-type peptidyl-prolyl cis-trans isomerase (trigger factor)
MPDKKYTAKATAITEKSEVEITGEITPDILASFRPKAIKNLGENANMPGFRKGHIPEKILVEKLGEVYILEEVADLALKDIAPEIIQEHAPAYIGRPQITVTKLAPGNPLEFKIIVAILPEVNLPDYKKIAKQALSKEEKIAEVTEKEIENVIEEVRKQRAHVEFHKANSKGEHEHTHNHADEDIEKHKPEFNDEFVKTVGDYKDVADFKNKVKENLTKEKEHRALEKRRGELLEKLVAETKISIPQVLIDDELNRMFAQFEQDISGMGLKIEDYLKHIKKTPEDLAKDWKPDAEKRAKLNLVLEEIAKKENLKADEKAAEEELKYLKATYKDQKIDELRAKLYIEHNLRIEKVIQFLEAQK